MNYRIQGLSIRRAIYRRCTHRAILCAQETQFRGPGQITARVADYTPAMFVADRVTLRSLLKRADSFLPGPLASHQDRQ